jgi:hypothetical protein
VLPAESFVDLPTWQHIDDCFEKAHWDAGVGVPLRASIPDINMDKKCPDDALLVEEAIGGRYRNILRTADSFANGGLAAAFAAENSLMICADEVLRAAGTSLQAEVE